MAKISILDIAKAVVSKHGLSQQDAEKFVTALFDVINEGLNREKIVKVKGLGTFKVIDVRERESVNVNTGERVVIESHGKITFTPDPIMRDLVNKPFAQFETVVLNDGVDLEEMSRIQVPEDESFSVSDDADYSENNDVEENGQDTVETIEASDSDGDADKNGGDETEVTAHDEPAVISDDAEPQPAEAEVSEDKALSGDEPDSVTDVENNVNSDVSSVVDKAENNEDVAIADAPESFNVTENADEDTSERPSDEETEADGTEEKSFLSRHSKSVFGFVCILIAAAAFTGGYYYGRNSVTPVVKYRTVRVAVKPEKTNASADTLQRADTTVVAKKEKTVTDTVRQAEPEKVEVSAKAVPERNGADSQELKNAGVMVKTGAYRITGTAETITVKRGETLKKISRFYLGDGMECYVQVHNGITEVTEGMKLKIPKLELKRRR